MILRPLLAAPLLAAPLLAAPPAPPSTATQTTATQTTATQTTAATAPPPARCASLVASDAWVRLLPPGSANTAAFFRLKNTGATDAIVVGAASPIAKRAGVHGMTTRDGVMRMFDVERVVVPAGGEVAFSPGGLHVMLFDQTAPHAGDAVLVNLRCDDGSTAVVTATAQAKAPPTSSSTPPTIAP